MIELLKSLLNAEDIHIRSKKMALWCERLQVQVTSPKPVHILAKKI